MTLLLDGATGSLLLPQLRAGMSCEQANDHRPELVLDMHRQYIAAGADIITTNTFCTGALAPSTARRAAGLAREAAGSCASRRVLVAGSIGPERCDWQAIASALIDGGADLLMLETAVDADLAAEALRGMRRADAEIPIIVSATLTPDGLLPSGHTLGEFADATAFACPLAAGLNCGTGPDSLVPLLPELRRALPPGTLTVLYPSAGLPGHTLSPDEFARKMMPPAADIIGGCCGTTPAHIAALAARLKAWQ